MANHPTTKAPPAKTPVSNSTPPRRDESRPPRPDAGPGSEVRHKLLYERYGLSENPFGVTPDPRYLYENQARAEARSSLIVGIECGVGFQALIAPPGMGKTTLLSNILERFDKVARTAFLCQTQGDCRDFLRYLITELGGEANDSDLVRMQETINQLLLRERRAGKQTIVIIDEAQSLDPGVLETIRLLSNFEAPSEKLLQVILCGQPQFAQRLASPAFAWLSQRISMVARLVPFNLEDTRKYVEHRLEVAGYKGKPLFTSQAVTLIWEQSGGVPREINRFCFNALLLATAVGREQIDSDVMCEVVEDLNLGQARPQAPMRISEMLGGQTGNEAHSGNETVEDLASSIDKLCDGGLADFSEEAEEGVAPTAFDDQPVLRDEPDTDVAAFAGTEATGPSDKAEELRTSGETAAVAANAAWDPYEPWRATAQTLDQSTEAAPVAATKGVEPASTLRIQPEADAELQPVTVWLSQQWQTYRATVYLGASGLILLLALVGWGTRSASTNSAEPNVTVSQKPAAEDSSAEPSPATVDTGNPDAKVWVDFATGVYYCPGSAQYGQTDGGRVATQRVARLDKFEPADGKTCP